MASLLVKNASVLVTMDEERREIARGGLYAEDGWLTSVGPTEELPRVANQVLDLENHLVLPGLVNTHHHLYQTLTRAVPAAQDVSLFAWLRTLYPIWARLTPEGVSAATTLGLIELARSGCTTAFDHQYLFPNGSRLDDQIEAAVEFGLRFHGSRGSMSLGESKGGLPPDSVVESEDAILSDTARLIDAYHNPEPGAMVRIVAAPCSPFSVTAELMRDAAEQARQHGIRLHTHLAETADEEAYCLQHHGLRPVDYAESLGWLESDVCLAHAVHVTDTDIGKMAATGTGVAHCPTSNMRLGSGTAPFKSLLSAGVSVGLGVDGSASNDGGHLLGEARQALLLGRHSESPVLGDGRMISARTVLEVATRGGASILGRSDVGSLEVGKACDFVAINLNRVEYAGALHDPVAAVLLSSPVNVDFNYVAGNPIIADGEVTTVEVPRVVERHNRLAAELMA